MSVAGPTQRALRIRSQFGSGRALDAGGPLRDVQPGAKPRGFVQKLKVSFIYFPSPSTLLAAWFYSMILANRK